MRSRSGAVEDLAVIVVNYRSVGLLRAGLARMGLREVPATIVIVDNSDDTSECARTRELCSEQGWVHLVSPGNIGFGAGVNAGVAHARARGAAHFLILNPDAGCDRETVRSLLSRSRSDPMLALAPRIHLPDGTAWFTGGEILMRRGRLRSRSEGSVDWVTGAVLMVSGQLWDLVGGFDEDYFLYWEDVDLSWRIRAAGGRLAVVSELSAWHSVGATQQAGVKSATFVRCNSRNRLVFAARNLKRREQAGWLAGTPRITWELVGMGGRTPQAYLAALLGTAQGIGHILRNG